MRRKAVRVRDTRALARCPAPSLSSAGRRNIGPYPLMPEKRYLLAAIVIIAIILVLAFVRL